MAAWRHMQRSEAVREGLGLVQPDPFFGEVVWTANRRCQEQFMCASSSRWFESEELGKATNVRFTGAKALDEPTSHAVGDELYQIVGKMAGRKLVLNFVDVTYLASGALAMLLTLNKRLRDVGGKLVLANLDPKLYEVFEITKLNQILEITKAENNDPQGS